jgi:hypothetical protein
LQIDTDYLNIKTLDLKRTDWNARNFIISIGQELIGQLSFNSIWNLDAIYTDKHTQLKVLITSAFLAGYSNRIIL